MKKLFILLFSVLFIFSATITTEAKAPETLTSTYIEYLNEDFYAVVEISTASENRINIYSSDIRFNSIVSPLLRLARKQLLKFTI